MILVYLLILILTILILYHLCSKIKNPIIEGLDNAAAPPPSPTSTSSSSCSIPLDAYKMANKNAADIATIQKQIGGIQDIKTQVYDLSMNVSDNDTQINALMQQTSKQASALTGVQPPASSSTK